MLELFDIYPERGVLPEADGLTVGLKFVITKHIVEGRQDTTQRPARVRLVLVGPKQRRKRVAPMALPGQGEIGEQRQCFTTIYVDRRSVPLNAGRTEQK